MYICEFIVGNPQKAKKENKKAPKNPTTQGLLILLDRPVPFNHIIISVSL